MQDSKAYNLEALLQRLSHNQYRQLVLFCGSQKWAATELNKLTCQASSFLTLSKDPAFNQAQWPEHLHQILGQEFEVAIYDGYSGIIPNKLAALSGTVKAGGILALVLPELEQLNSWCDPGIVTWQNHEQSLTTSPFLTRWQSLFVQLPISIISETNDARLYLPDLKPASELKLRLGEQDKVIETLTILLAKSQQHILLTADRGRGKSSALGLLASKLPEQSFVVCARQYQAVKSSFTHLAKALGVEYTGHEKTLANLRFCPPDQLLQENISDDIILVDEAAALPVPTLIAIANRFKRCVFASTLVGYEGNGRGYTLRFKRFLAKHYPTYQQLTLNTPIRYEQGDPLESCINKLFALDAEFYAPSRLENYEFVTLSTKCLLANEPLLRQAFSLLVLAHYQTSVNDLRQLLDQPAIKLFAIKQQDHLLGICMVSIEGALKTDSILAITQQNRRPKGHLLPQQLYHLQQQQAFLSYKAARVVRIAIAPEFQSQKLGQQLLQFTEQQLQDEVDYFGSSFGCTAQLLKFWQENDYQIVKLGFKQDKASGEYSAIVLKSKNKRIKEQNALTAYFSQQLTYQLLTHHQMLNYSLVSRLLKPTCDDVHISAEQKQQLAILLDQPAHIEQGLALIWQITTQNPQVLYNLSAISHRLLIRLVLQGNKKDVVQKELCIDSKKQLNQCLFNLVAEIYAQT